MTLFVICTENTCGDIEPIFDSETGAPSVFFNRENAQAEVDEINQMTDGGYFVVPFSPEDEPSP
jgi:hypothetical protein